MRPYTRPSRCCAALPNCGNAVTPLAQILFDPGHRHVTRRGTAARRGAKANIPVSLATVYNRCISLLPAGLLRQVVVEAGRAYFDTNIGIIITSF